MGPKTEKGLFPKVSREKLGTVSNEVSRERTVLEGTVWMKKVRNITRVPDQNGVSQA